MTIKTWSTPNFRQQEFWCPCCSVEKMDLGFIRRLQAARDVAGIPFVITEGGGYRCLNYNRSIGSKDDSAHPKGEAGDIAITLLTIYVIVAALIEVKFKRIGISQGRKFLHVDDDQTKPMECIWIY